MNIFLGALVNIYAGRSGEQLSLIDGNSKHRPLLLEMTQSNTPFMNGLKQFAHVYVYANTSNDNTVPYCTSSLSYKNKWKAIDPKSHVAANDDYSFILECENINGDVEEEEHKDKHLTKAYEITCWNTLLISLIVLIAVPLLIVHILLLALPLRITSMCFTRPDEANFCKMSPLEGTAAVDPDLCPFLILKNMRTQLNIHRVSVMIPGPHTHGLIVCRFQPNSGGLDVIRHLVNEVLSQHPDTSSKLTAAGDSDGDAADALGEDLTNININMIT
jgi:hypothetical protein